MHTGKYYGKINAAWSVFLASVAALAAMLWLLMGSSSKKTETDSARTLLVFCAPALQKPVQAAALEYEKLTGVKVQFQFQPSQMLLTSAELTKRGDVFLPADDSFNDAARKKNLIAEMIPLTRVHAVIAVMKGNPKHVGSLRDLGVNGVKFAQANPDAGAIGILTRQAFEKAGTWSGLKDRTTAFKGTPNDVASDITIGSVDAGIIWNAMVPQFSALEAVEDPELAKVTAKISVALLRTAQDTSGALKFMRFLSARDRGLQEFKNAGYEVEEGDVWAETPELKFFAGAMLRPAIEQTIADFEKREGVRVTRIYNGCGILVSQMRAAKDAALPDAYFACDKSFMTQVSDLFLDASDVSQNQLVILVPKGNPRNIRALKDLGMPELKIGIGHEKQCALGALTSETFKVSGVFENVMKNVKVQSATGDLLVNQLLTGSLDAVVAYVSNATGSADKLDAIRIDIPCALAVQPLAIGRESKNKRLAARLTQALQSAGSRAQFEAQGFTWKDGAR